ncbi:MAG: hypothetical protein ACM3JL_01275 [Nitrososphaerota archaeon]
MKRAIFSFAVLAGLLFPAAAQAGFGIAPGSFSATATNADGTIDSQAGSHPFDFTVSFKFNLDESGEVEGGLARDIIVDLPPGFAGNPLAVPRCTRQQYEGAASRCPGDTQVGLLKATIPGLGQPTLPIFNIVPPPGVAAQLGGQVINLSTIQNASVRTEEGYGLEVGVFNVPAEVSEATETIWGVPADPAHDSQRGIHAFNNGEGEPSSAPLQPFLTLPTSCVGVPEVTLKADSEFARGVFAEETVPFRDGAGTPAPLAGCAAVPFSPRVTVQPTSGLAASPAGLDFGLKLPDDGLLGPSAIAETEPRKTVVTLPEGVTVNASLAAGIGVCTPAQYGAEQLGTPPGGGCPESSKLGSVVARTPLLEEAIEGSLYLAAPYDNPFGTLTALYLVARAPQRGVLVKQAGKVELDRATGQITTTFDDLPPLPYSDFKLHFREGARAPLVTPPACGEFRTVARLTPFSVPSDEGAVTVESPFQIERGADGGACPTGGLPPFHPGLLAGTIDNAAGSYSPLYLRLSRGTGEQEITRFSIKLPPGLVAKLAGVPFCPEGAIAAARAREGTPHGGSEELASPSCPAASQIGRTVVGAGVGSALAYAPGKLYLAGPYNGSPLSVLAVTAAKVGPFDLGTVVVREALRVDPETAEVFVDAAGSDPLPHIIAGVPVQLRDIRVYVERPKFTLNPTSCAPMSIASPVLGAGLDLASEADDSPVTVSIRFQAADCGSLGFRPRISLTLKGGTKRGQVPRLKAVARPRRGDANIRRAVVTLPASEFLEQGHIGTICTRVQFAAGPGNGAQCPPGSVYGHARATSPLLDETLSGPVFLRANGGARELPDLVAALHSAKVDIDLVGYVDSVPIKGTDRSRIRNTFAAAPDAPVSRFVLEMAGGKRGLIVNSADLCRRTHRARAAFTAHNGRRRVSHPAVRTPGCRKKGRHRRGHRRHG